MSLRLKPARFQRLLLDWFDQHGRKHLPWQQDKSPYRIFISEIMLQQTQVSTVVGYFDRFIQHFPDIATLASAHEDAVLHLWAGLGYYSRARNLHRAAKIVMSEHHGRFPDQFTDLIQLPGIGPSTANAILSIAFNQPAAILDGNVKRVLARVFAIEAPINIKTTEQALWTIAQQYMPTKRAADYTQAIMDLGATLCTRTQALCTQCPFRRDCLAYQQNQVALLPLKTTKRPLPTRAATLLVFKNNTQVLLHKRPAPGIWGGLWSLPQIDNQLCMIALKQMLKSTPFTLLSPFRHTFTHYHLDIFPVLVKVKKIPATIQIAPPFVWYDLANPQPLGLPKPISTILNQLPIAARKKSLALV